MCLTHGAMVWSVIVAFHALIQRGGGGQEVRTLSKDQKLIGFPSNTGPDPLKITKLQSQHSMRAIIGRPAKRNFISIALRWQADNSDNCPLFVTFGASLP